MLIFSDDNKKIGLQLALLSYVIVYCKDFAKTPRNFDVSMNMIEAIMSN